MVSIKKSAAILIAASALLMHVHCASGKAVRHVSRLIPPGNSIAIIIDSPNSLKNIVLSRFMQKGYNVKAVNASDFYTIHDVFDINDFKRVSRVNRMDNLLSMEKTVNNIFKLHIYGFEVNKAEMLAEMRNRWNVNYLVLLELGAWEDISWGRAIDLRTNEVVWLENYPTKYNDTLESVIDHFIVSMSRPTLD